MTTGIERRIRFGEWLVAYDDARMEVALERKLIDILTATPGDDQECMNSRCIRAQRNAHIFPHPVLMVSTTATRVIIIDQLSDDGLPVHAIRYQLGKRDRELILNHDRNGEGQPGVLRLRVPNDPKGSPKRSALRPSWSGGATPERYGGDVKSTETPNPRPVTAIPKGAEHRYLVAVGALK